MIAGPHDSTTRDHANAQLAPCRNRPAISFRTLGCRVNQYESDAMRARLSIEYDVDVTSAPADLVIVNGCTVTALAASKTRKAIRQTRRESPNAIIVLIGCLAEASARHWGDPGEADLTAGNAWKRSVSDVARLALSGRRGDLGDAPPASLEQESIGASFSGLGNRIRGFLKVQDGCSGVCTYCQTRLVRGPSQSKSIAAVMSEAGAMVAAGVPELVLSGINLSEYSPVDGDLADLVREIDGLPGLRRLRLGSINPEGVSDRLLGAMSTVNAACPHLHIAIQSGDDGVLRRMNRRYTTADVVRRIEAARESVRGITFGTDIIVGFPGESEAAFGNTCSLIERLQFINLHLFRYSRRVGTAAIHLVDHVDGTTKHRRASMLERRWHIAVAQWLADRVGERRRLLVEERRQGGWCGYTQDYVDLRIEGNPPLRPGDEADVVIASSTGCGWTGELSPEAAETNDLGSRESC